MVRSTRVVVEVVQMTLVMECLLGFFMILDVLRDHYDARTYVEQLLLHKTC